MFLSPTEREAVIRVDSAPSRRKFKPDPIKVDALFSVVEDPLQRQAIALLTGLFDGQKKSITDVSRIMRLDEAQAKQLISQGTSLLTKRP